MLADLTDARRLASSWSLPYEDVVLIALNHCGLANADRGARCRMVLELDGREGDPVHLILSLRRASSPFELVGDRVCLDGAPFASVVGIDADDAVLGYWRNDHRALTLNSNARSQCVGCVFCPNTLEASADPTLGSGADLASYFAAVAAHEGGLAHVDRVTVCTGCFRYEHLALKHLAEVRALMTSHGCSGTLHFLSSVLETNEGLVAARQLSPFHLTLTAECFTRRAEVLKDSKARLSAADLVDVLGRAAAAGLMTDFTYIVGMDPIADATRWTRRLAAHTSTFPRLQVYQSHTALMDAYLLPEAKQLAYYLELRKVFEELFGPAGLRPKPWENYRSLWYFAFADEPLVGARI